MRCGAIPTRRNGSGANCSASCNTRYSSIAAWLPQFVRFQRQMMHVAKRGFIFRHWLAECAERGRKELDAIEIGAHAIDHTMQLAPHSIYGRLRSHNTYLFRSLYGVSYHCVGVCKVKTLGGGWFLFSETSRVLD